MFILVGVTENRYLTIQELVPRKREASRHLNKGIRIKHKRWLKASQEQSKACTKTLQWETAGEKCSKGKGEDRVARELWAKRTRSKMRLGKGKLRLNSLHKSWQDTELSPAAPGEELEVEEISLQMETYKTYSQSGNLCRKKNLFLNRMEIEVGCGCEGTKLALSWLIWKEWSCHLPKLKHWRRTDLLYVEGDHVTSGMSVRYTNEGIKTRYKLIWHSTRV